MKLSEIKPTLQKVCNMSWVVNLNEIFDTKFTDITWKVDNFGAKGYAKLKNEEFIIKLEPGTWVFDDKTYNFINCSFEKIVDGKPTTEIQFNSKNASAIIGAIANAIHQQLQKYEIDAFVFAATDNIQDRMRIYDAVAVAKKIPGFHMTIRDVPMSNGKMTVTVNSAIPRDKIDDFIKYLKEITK